MIKYKIEIKRSAQKEFKSLSQNIQKILIKAIQSLETQPRSFHSRKLTGSSLWRLRVGRYRVLYTIDDKERLIVLIRVSHRQSSYK